ncbi:hypothetical protein D3C86_1070340 [compost metagenome]
MQVASQAQQRHSQRRATAFAKPQAEIEQGLRVQGFQHMTMPWLGAAMTEQQPLTTLWIQAHRNQRRDTANEAIHQHRNTFLGTGEIRTDQRGDFKTAEVEQGLQGIATLRAMQCQGALDHLGLVADTFGIEPGARPGQMHHRAIEQRARQGAGGGGVTDAHFATDKQLCTAGDCPQHAVTAGLQGELPLGLGHGRSLYKICRARADVQVAYTRQAQRRRYRAKVNHF